MAKKKNKMKLGDILSDIVAPAGAVIASTYGPRYAGAAAIGMHAVNNIQEGKRRRRLGEEIVKLADMRAEEDLNVRRGMWNQVRETATAVKPGEAAFSDQDIMEHWGIENPIASENVREQKNEDFLKKMPEPTRAEIYDLAGAVAMEDPDAAMEMISDRAAFQDQIAMMRMDQVFKQGMSEAEMRAEASKNAAKNRVDQLRMSHESERWSERLAFDKSKAEADAAYRAEDLALRRQTAEAAAASATDKNISTSIRALQEQIVRREDSMRDTNMYTEKDIQKEMAPWYLQLDGLIALANGSELVYDPAGMIDPATGKPIDNSKTVIEPGGAGLTEQQRTSQARLDKAGYVKPDKPAAPPRADVKAANERMSDVVIDTSKLTKLQRDNYEALRQQGVAPQEAFRRATEPSAGAAAMGRLGDMFQALFGASGTATGQQQADPTGRPRF